MTMPEDFIEDFLQHRYDPIKAHEYYVRTRKLKGRKTAPPKQSRGMDFNDDARLDTSQIRDKRAKNDPTRGKGPKARYDREDRLEEQQRKIDAARARIKNAEPKKRNALEKKLDAIERELDKARKFKKSLSKIKLTKNGKPVRIDIPDLPKLPRFDRFR